MELSLCMISIKVNDVEKAVKFYCDGLGFNLEKKYGENIVELSFDGHSIILEKAEKENTLNYFENAQTVLGIRSNNLFADMKVLQERGVELLFKEPQKCPPGIFNVIQDPFGNHIEILEFQ